jgi:hypothetical protein
VRKDLNFSGFNLCASLVQWVMVVTATKEEFWQLAA